MRKSTFAISLTLVGSGLILSGCGGRRSEGETARDTGREARSAGHGGGYYHVGGDVVPGASAGGHAEGAGGKGAAVSHGGFGAAGHAAGGS